MIDQAECRHDEDRVKEAFHSDPYWQSADLLCLSRYTIRATAIREVQMASDRITVREGLSNGQITAASEAKRSKAIRILPRNQIAIWSP